MSEEKDLPQVPEVKNEQESVEAQPQEETLGEALHEEKSQEDDGRVPREVFVNEKKSRKKYEKEVKELNQEIDRLRKGSTSMSDSQVDDKVKSLSEKYPEVDPTFFSDMKTLLTGDSSSQELKKEIEELKMERQREAAETKFNKLFDKALGSMPEYGEVVNKNVIKSLAFDPSNSKKTVSQIIEEAYGKTVDLPGTLERSGGSSRKEDGPSFMNPTEKDYEMINSNPDLKQKHTSHVLENLKRSL